MLLAVAATLAPSSPPPEAAGLSTAAAFGQVLFSGPSATSFQLFVAPNSVSNVPELIRPRYFLNTWLVPDWSRRTIFLISVSALQPVPETLSPPSVIWLHLVMVPRSEEH